MSGGRLKTYYESYMTSISRDNKINLSYPDADFMEKAKNVALACALEGGDMAMKYRKRLSTSKIWRKEDGSIVTEADIVIQEEIFEKINSEFADHVIIGEEDSPAGYYKGVEKSDSLFVWLVDPIDGTRMYLQKRSTYYGTAICLLYDGNPVLAVFFAPEYRISGKKRGGLFEAYCHKEGAYLNKRVIRASSSPQMHSQSAIISRTIQEDVPSWKDLFNVHFLGVFTRTGSGTLGLCRAACSGSRKQPSVYIFGPTHLWNVVPGCYIVIKAGGICTDIHGNSIFPINLKLSRRSNFTQNSIMAGNPNISRNLISLFRASKIHQVKILGYRAEGVNKVDSRNPACTMGEIASSSGLVELAIRYQKINKSEYFRKFKDKKTNGINSRSVTLALANGNQEEKKASREVLQEFGIRLACVISRLLSWEYWRGTERIYIGGGLSVGIAGDIMVATAKRKLEECKTHIDIQRLHYNPDEAGLIGSAYLFSPDILSRGVRILALDIGATKFRTGIVKFSSKEGDDQLKPEVRSFALKEHAFLGLDRDGIIDLIIESILNCIYNASIDPASSEYYIGIGCPGTIDAEGNIVRGATGLPGDWTKASINIPSLINLRLSGRLRGEIIIKMHNDAVVQGLSMLPFVQDIEQWGILSIGTGLGNACFRK